MSNSLPCIVCDKELEDVLPDNEDHNQPYAGTTFTTQGHYGSTFFDPMDGSFLELNICDDCLRQKKDKLLRGRIVAPTKTEVRYVSLEDNV